MTDRQNRPAPSLVAAELAARRDDAILLQEVVATRPAGYPDVIGALTDALADPSRTPYHWVYDDLGDAPPTVDGGAGVTGQLVLTRRLPVTVPDAAAVAPMRSVTHVRVGHSLGAIDLFDVHLEGGESAEALFEVEALLAFVDKAAAADGIAIVAGDFNNEPDSSVFERLRAAGFVDLAQASGLDCAPPDDRTG